MTQNDKLSQAIEARLVADERTRDAVIQVSAASGELTLRGSVDSEEIKKAAEQIAQSTAGATLVISELVVTTDEQRREENTVPRIPVVPAGGQGYGGGGFPTGSGNS
ncbi:MAG: BON domain-containing protein [Chloroflexota bacterium]